MLDSKGLVALWRETLLAKNVLAGKTKGYKHHPQLKRFKSLENPKAEINAYLSVVYDESLARGYNFDPTKFDYQTRACTIPVTRGQVNFELQHLKKKLDQRAPDLANSFGIKRTRIHPLFNLVDGEVEDWEVIG